MPQSFSEAACWRVVTGTRRSWKEPRQPLREVPPAELPCTRKQVVWYCAPQMTNPSDDLSRRSFLKASLAGAAVSLAKIPATTETNQKDQKTKPVSGGPSDDLTRMSIREVADLIRKKKVSPVELTTACLARIDRINPALNAFITITAEPALEQAREAEAEVQRGKWRGPLHGVPIALKDLFDTAGVKTDRKSTRLNSSHVESS